MTPRQPGGTSTRCQRPIDEESGMEYRSATARDAKVIARLHADSWRRNYRGAYSTSTLLMPRSAVESAAA